MANDVQVALMLGKIDARLSHIETSVAKLDETVNGNGKPGMIEDHRQLQNLVRLHCERDEQDRRAREKLAEDAAKAKELLARDTQKAKDKLAEETKEKKEKISGRTWMVIMVFITQFVGLIFLFIRTGGFK